MSILLTVVEAGSLSAGGRRLGVPLPTVSRKIADLEAHLGSRLLNRSSRRLALTEAGQTYIIACRRILGEIDEAERAASGEYHTPKGDLIITAPNVLGRLHLLPVVGDFLKAYPEVDIRLTLSDRAVNLLEEQVDLALRIGPLADSSLIATRLGTIRQVICGSPAYFAARGIPQHPNDLVQHDCVTFPRMMSPDLWRFRQNGAEIAIPVRSRLIVDTAEAACDAAIAGLGITCLFCYQARAAAMAGELRFILQNFDTPAVPVSFLYPSGRLIPLKLRSFLDFATPPLKTRLADRLPK